MNFELRENEMAGVLVIAEVVEGQLPKVNAELMGLGRKLADQLGEPLEATVAAASAGEAAQQLIALGADKVYAVEDALLEPYQSDGHLKVTEKVIGQAQPSVVLMGQTFRGRDLAPRLAFRLGTALATDCIDITVGDDKRLRLLRGVYGGNAQAVFTIATNPQVATVRAKTQEEAAPDAGRSGEVVKVESGLSASDLRLKLVEHVKEQAAGVKLEDADIVVSGGRGLGEPANFSFIEELAAALGGAVGASRAVVDEGWQPSDRQVGLSGKVVSPNLYVAVAISGASQHMAGCSGSKVIVAVNKDKDAPIFKFARYGIVGDYKAVLPPLTAKVKDLRS
jgi:electron transfer flavoprotein alpha subunit